MIALLIVPVASSFRPLLIVLYDNFVTVTVISRYIEGLSTESKYISNWDRMLRATQSNSAVVDEARLPAHWLANGPGNYGNATNALWALRDFMLRDAFNISKVI